MLYVSLVPIYFITENVYLSIHFIQLPLPSNLLLVITNLISFYVSVSVFLFFFFQFLLQYSCFIMCQFLLYSKVNQVNQLHLYICPLFFEYPSHLGHHRAMNRVFCAIQQVLICYLFYTQYQQCMYISICESSPPNISHPLLPHPPYPYASSLCL